MKRLCVVLALASCICFASAPITNNYKVYIDGRLDKRLGVGSSFGITYTSPTGIGSWHLDLDSKNRTLKIATKTSTQVKDPKPLIISKPLMVNAKPVIDAKEIDGEFYVPLSVVTGALGLKKVELAGGTNLIRPPIPRDSYGIADGATVDETLIKSSVLHGFSKNIQVSVSLDVKDGVPELRKSLIQDTIEAKLLTNGFNIVKSYEDDVLYIYFSVVAIHNQYSSSLAIELTVDGHAYTTAGRVGRLVTLDHQLSVASYGDKVIEQAIKDTAEEYITSFIVKYLKANPTKPKVSSE